MCLLAVHLLQCPSSLCLYPGSGLSLSCFYIASLWLQRFLWVGLRRVVFAPSSLCVWSQRSWRSRQIILLPLGFPHVHLIEFVYTALQCRSSMSSNSLVFHTSGGISSSSAAFLFLIFLVNLIYMYKVDLALNNLQWLICHKNQPNPMIYI